MLKLINSVCSDCRSDDLVAVRESGEVQCRKCGLIVEEKLVDFSPDWSFDEDGSRNSRAGAPLDVSKADFGMVTSIGNRKDIMKMDPGSRAALKRLIKWNSNSVVAIQRNLQHAFNELKRISAYLKIPTHIEKEAASLYRLAVQRGLVKGRSIEVIIAGTLYASCRIFSLPRTLDEVSEAAGINKKEIGRTYRFVVRQLGITVKSSNPIDYLPRFRTLLSLSAKVETTAVELIIKAQNIELTSGRGPTGIAAAALYVSSLIHGEKRTQREVADVAGVTEVTIRNRYKELIKKLKLTKAVEKSKKK